MTLPRIQFTTTSDGFRIAYAITEGAGEPLIMVPGWLSHLEHEWAAEANRTFYERLARSHTLVLYDGRGTGMSDREAPDLSVQARLRDLEAVVELVNAPRVSIFAWSQGSPVAMQFAVEHPERVSKLILFAAFCGSSRMEEEKALPRAILDLIRAEWGVGARTTMGFVHPDADREETEASLALLRAAGTGDVAARILEEGFFHTNVCDKLPGISAPTLVLHRRQDKAVPLEAGRQVASLIPNARFVVLEGDHHLPYSGNVDALVRAIEEFAGVPTPEPAEAPAGRRQVPAGPPVTILFTDMEGSTSLTQRLGDSRAQELVRAHDAIVRDALAAHGGAEVKHTGDGIMASFPSASGALDCAIEIQRKLARYNQEHPEEAVAVRIGLNAGEPVREQDDLFGHAVQVARRVCDMAAPGQILASNVVRELVAGKGFLFADQGETALRGFEDPVRLYEVRWSE
jgi:class 3 adenylate cyclase/pimeloyl-ACP methyl ester carboxylesterase